MAGSSIGDLAPFLTIPVGLLSAVIAWRAGRAASRSAAVAEDQRQLTHVDRVAAWRPPMSMILSAVHTRWSTNEEVWTRGKATETGFRREDSLPWARLKAEHMHAEILVTGRLVNHTDTELLVSAGSMFSRGVSYPLRNEGLFLVGGEDRNNFILSPGEHQTFTWVDRRPAIDWLAHYRASEEGRMTELPKEVPDPRAENSIWQRVGQIWSHGASAMLRKREKVLMQGSFRVVADSRAAERVSTVWTARLSRSALQPRGRDADGELVWGLAPTIFGKVDDDVILYRSHIDVALARLKRPRVTHVPGRF